MLQFNVSRNVALLPISLYTLGFVFGPCIAAPISELHGHRVVYRTNIIMLVIFSAIAAASDNFVVLVVFRFLAGVGGSGVMAVGAGTLSDLWLPSYLSRVGVAYILAPFLGPSMGPLIGAYSIAQYDDWKWAIWTVLCILAPVVVGVFYASETSKTRILYIRAKKRGHAVKGQSLRVELQKIAQIMVKPWHIFAVMFSFFGSYAYVYSQVYAFDTKQTGLCYIGVIVGILFWLVTFAFFDAVVYQKQVVKTGDKVAPEYYLCAALFGSFLIPISLFWYAWAPRESIHWIVPVLAGLPFGWGTLASFLACLAYLTAAYGPEDLASAFAANGIVRYTLGAVFPMFIIQCSISSGALAVLLEGQGVEKEEPLQD
ncbi:hypothetical protein FZEAL_4062 [Fusarium zealandicum]|uniref:Major facilitator superfamily (MFS) profile domain-containing protein n=1 Tax=Fusarium zealandicum TaxID=1053134 RepID=A0A8H4UN34_9HYPO|nr:hypothetical protein FZEAL_4062 [Fusarium zealandicum]